MARLFARAGAAADADEAVELARERELANAEEWKPSDRLTLTAMTNLLADLARQGWGIQVRNKQVRVSAPQSHKSDVAAEKERLRRQELVKRDAQLRKAPVRKFVKSMEKRRLFNGRFVSVFSLMREGRELAGQLERARAGDVELRDVVDPYLEFVDDERRCSWTGLRLMDIWRYFRHTWSSHYSSVPGRSMLFLVRDRAAEFHPVVGLCALASPIVQIRERDVWIGWHPDTMLEELRSKPTVRLARWLLRTVQDGLDELFLDDLIADGWVSPRQIKKPTPAVIRGLLEHSAEERTIHQRLASQGDLKRSRSDDVDPAEFWEERAKTHLFRSKRALALADLLQARRVLAAHLGEKPTARKLGAMAATTEGAGVVRKMVKRAKAERVGILMADISVCGAVDPYRPLLGGKLVSMLAASPEVVTEYQRRYQDAQSEIASAMAGRPVIRRPSLVLLSTTSMYGVAPSQYNRIKLPCEAVGGEKGEVIEYRRLGKSESFGTNHFSDQTREALVDVVQQRSNGTRVNSVFGEGQSPLMRRVREGLDQLGLPSEQLLQHHRPRIVYGVSLVRNARDFLLGLTKKPDYLLPMEAPGESSAAIAEWWRQRWLAKRINSDEVLSSVSTHTLIRPIRHGARVPMRLATEEKNSLFPEYMMG